MDAIETSGWLGDPPLRWAFSSARFERGVRDTGYRGS